MYEVETRVLKQAVRRNRNRFPEDFMFQLTRREWREVITNCDNLPNQVKFSPQPPFVFTEQGVAMLSSVLGSEKAIDVNISIMSAFVLLRKHLTDYASLKERIEKLELEMNVNFKDIHQTINHLLRNNQEENASHERKRIGFKP